MIVNDLGKAAVQRIFPNRRFDWRQAPDPWAGWVRTVEHVPSLVATQPNTLPLELAPTPLQEADDGGLSYLMACAANNQGVRAAWFEIVDNERPSLNLLDSEDRRDPKLNAPTMLPLQLDKREDAFLYAMLRKAEANLAWLDGTAEPFRKIIAGSELVVAIWQDLSQRHGIDFLIVRGDEELVQKSAAVEAVANAFFVNDREAAVAFKQVWTEQGGARGTLH
jgi:hypothetical protein